MRARFLSFAAVALFACDREPTFVEHLGAAGATQFTPPDIFAPKPTPAATDTPTTAAPTPVTAPTACATSLDVSANWLGTIGALGRIGDVLYLADERGLTSYALDADCPAANAIATLPPAVTDVRALAPGADSIAVAGASEVGVYDLGLDASGTCDASVRSLAFVGGTLYAAAGTLGIFPLDPTAAHCGEATGAGGSPALAIAPSEVTGDLWAARLVTNANGSIGANASLIDTTGAVVTNTPTLGADGAVCGIDAILESSAGDRVAILDRACQNFVVYDAGSAAATSTGTSLGTPRAFFPGKTGFVFVFATATATGATLRFATLP